MHLLVARLSIALILLQSILQPIERRGYDSAFPACRAVGKADLADCLLTVCSRRAGRCCLGAKGPIRLSGCKSLGTMPRGMPSQQIPGLPPVGVGPKPSEVWLVLLFVARARHNKKTSAKNTIDACRTQTRLAVPVHRGAGSAPTLPSHLHSSSVRACSDPHSLLRVCLQQKSPRTTR